ncbi:M23 family metallopeptidase [Rhodalgimonas zhirmunskyi]|uniref:M23 family metallopeptidase n=1 Tax=Rhodalgimonas zhirmunskyi TaxID=2964767 RepID=A0AAJ1U7L6_9RHOB|nr:M23 family metallopeptidase [Rhodoalgimonas zhirmunskyi]MDQ2095080.1 M23 family metallopeptidase [Rhodoalgimonas zhirmunskyi]
MSYDGHKGTDFALPTRAEMESGVAALAAAPGRVVGLRDGQPDGAYLKDPDSTKGRECGNGVVIDHGDGWQTQYCHLRRGTLSVKVGQQVTTGTPLGQVGLSGNTEFPHVHLSVRHDGKTIDPFDPDGTAVCALASDVTLWTDPPLYQPGGLIEVGFIDEVPSYELIKSGRAGRESLNPDAPALILWAYGFGARSNDRVTLTITGPNGFFQTTASTIKNNKALFSRHMGKRHRADWPKGTYTGTVILSRGDVVISQSAARMVVGE